MMDTAELKKWYFDRSVAELHGFGCEIDPDRSSIEKPWGAYIRVREESIRAFYTAYWTGIDVPEPGLKLAPKILIVAPGARLSLQYHHRRREHWRVMEGPVGIVHGSDVSRLEETVAGPGDVIRLAQGEIHRLVGLGNWGRIAEIWEHSQPESPSDEEDIVRVEDDYGR